MELSIKDLERVLAKVKEAEENNFNTAEVKMDSFQGIIKGVARKYASKWVDREELEQDLWVRVMELIDACGGVEYTDANLVAKVCYRKAVDVYRYNRRRYESKVALIDENEEWMDDYTGEMQERGTGSSNSGLSYSPFETGYDIVVMKELIDLFAEGSKERKYVLIKLHEAGLLKDEYAGEKIESPTGDKEEDILKLLGYTSHCPGSWTVKKRRMYELVKEYLK